MAAGNTSFKVDHGLVVVGAANISGTLAVGGDLSISGNMSFSGTANGDYRPINNTFALGNTTNRWTLFALDGLFSANVEVGSQLSVTGGITSNGSIPSANNRDLGSSTRLWTLYANVASIANAQISGSANVGSTLGVVGQINTSNNLVVAGTANVTGLTTLSANLTVAGQSVLTGNVSTNATLVAFSSTANVNQTFNATMTFDTDVLAIDAVNNRVGIKNTAPSAQGVLTITGNTIFNANNTGLKFFASANDAASANASITFQGNTTTGSLVLNAFDISNTTNGANGGFTLTGTNSSATFTILRATKTTLQYNSSNVAHGGNFGIYNVSGTRVGP